MNSGAGSATNAGINYQQRVSATFLLTCLFETEISLFFNSHKFNKKIIHSIQLEGIDKIDDLIIKLDNQEKLFCQIKRKVNLSDSKASDFYKTIDQFIQQYLNNNTNEYFCLFTTSYSSSKITRELNKLTDSIRLNDLAFIENPLNKSEKETLDKYRKIVKKLFKYYTKCTMSEDEFISFSKRVFINNFDIESNSPIEKSILLLIHVNTIVDPSILWEMMISKCLTYASQRLVVNYTNLYEQYNSYLKGMNTTENKAELEFDDFLQPKLDNLNIASGKEVLLCKSNKQLIDKLKIDKNTDYFIIELYRFDEECNKKVSFTNNKCILSDNSTSLELILRASSNKRIESFMIDNKNDFENSSVLHIPAKDIDYIEHSNCAKLYTNKLVSKFKANKELLKCIECGKAISENNSIIAEIDEIGLSNEIGLIHKLCLRPTIRVLGWIESELFQNYNISNNFNWKLWVKKIIKGQGLFSNDIIKNINKEIKIQWNSSIDYTQQYNYCVKEYLEDGTTSYVLRRGQVDRFNKKESEDGAVQLNNLLLKKELENDYLCITNKERAFGSYNTLKNLIDFDDKLIKIKKYEAEKISQQIINEYKTMDNYYAPLIYITIGENQNIFSIDNMIVLLSEPLEINKYIENWKINNIHVDNNIELIIIEDDKYFDNFMHKCFNNNMRVIINPKFNLDGELTQSIEVEKFEDMEKNYG